MKKMFSFLFFFALLATMPLFAQAPSSFQYQTVLRGSDGKLLQNQSVNVRFTLRKTSAEGAKAFQETQTATTNTNGVINLQIGTGAINTTYTSLAEVDWTSGVYFMQVEIDNGSGYVTLSTQQLLSIPYAKFAQAAGSVRIKSPDGATWNVTIGNDGAISTTKVQ